MSTVVWVMVGFSYSIYLSFGPEFKSKELCEKAAVVITTEMTTTSILGTAVPSRPKCIRIEK